MSTSDELSQQSPPQQQEVAAPAVKEKEKEKECVHRTKTIQFLGRTTPVVLQNDNGPCPLLAICNVLLLRNNLNLSPDISEVSQENLLSLVAERLIDSNSNVNNKDAGYVENQQQNIADAIDLLPRLATGIDVNIKFRRIDDFEFTPECAIFDLLDIPLYHGWIVDPLDFDAATAIGSKSYNGLMGELVALETQNIEVENKNYPEEDCIDFAAATTATLGVPSPCLSKAKSFDDSPHSLSDHQIAKKGDLEEEAELSRVLKLSKAELPTSVGDILAVDINGGVESRGDDITCLKVTAPVDSVDTDLDSKNSPSGINDKNLISLVTLPGEMGCSMSKTDQSDHLDQSTCRECDEHISSNDVINKSNIDSLDQIEVVLSYGKNTAFMDERTADISGAEKAENQSVLTTDVQEVAEVSSGRDSAEVPGLSATNLDLDSSSGGVQNIDAPETYTSSVDGSEPIYEGEECILDSGTNTCEDREPMYEGEVILAEQADKSVRSKDEITAQQGKLIRNFLKNTASQLTFYGLFCLRDGLKERELCVFFRNNHFSTMFKYDGELYLLATDQGYLNQPDLVWEKLNEVNGDTLFMTGNFKEFKMESHANDTWDENNAMDYLASIDGAAQSSQDINSDLQLAIALQQQEFEQQQPQRHVSQQPVGSKLITGPRVASSSRRHASSASSRAEAKPKDKCVVM